MVTFLYSHTHTLQHTHSENFWRWQLSVKSNVYRVERKVERAVRTCAADHHSPAASVTQPASWSLPHPPKNSLSWFYSKVAKKKKNLAC